jgi:hypothetical protein
MFDGRKYEILVFSEKRQHNGMIFTEPSLLVNSAFPMTALALTSRVHLAPFVITPDK